MPTVPEVDEMFNCVDLTEEAKAAAAKVGVAVPLKRRKAEIKWATWVKSMFWPAAGKKRKHEGAVAAAAEDGEEEGELAADDEPE